jgi:hypothetical protein
LDLTQPDTVHFRFFGGMVWTVRLHAEKKFALPIMSNPKGVNRPFAFFRMFEIDSRPLPDTSQAENRRAESS